MRCDFALESVARVMWTHKCDANSTLGETSPTIPTVASFNDVSNEKTFNVIENR